MSKKYNIDDLTMENIVAYMNDELREKVHSREVPCSNEHFLVAYYEELQLSEQHNTEGFFDILLYEFDINIEELQDIERVKSYDGCIWKYYSGKCECSDCRNCPHYRSDYTGKGSEE